MCGFESCCWTLCVELGFKQPQLVKRFGWEEPLSSEGLVDVCGLFKINFYWSVVTLQCCVSCYCIAKQISHPYILSLLDSPHSGHHRALSRVPCAPHPVLLSDVFYTEYQ